MGKKRKVPKGYHIRRETIAKNPERYKSVGEKFDENLKKDLKKSGLY